MFICQYIFLIVLLIETNVSQYIYTSIWSTNVQYSQYIYTSIWLQMFIVVNTYIHLYGYKCSV